MFWYSCPKASTSCPTIPSMPWQFDFDGGGGSDQEECSQNAVAGENGIVSETVEVAVVPSGWREVSDIDLSEAGETDVEHQQAEQAPAETPLPPPALLRPASTAKAFVFGHCCTPLAMSPTAPAPTRMVNARMSSPTMSSRCAHLPKRLCLQHKLLPLTLSRLWLSP